MISEQLRYPIGRWTAPSATPSPAQLAGWIDNIAAFPDHLEMLVTGLGNELHWPYRPEGWTIRQVVHHCGDSHLNALIRFKLALTEDNPTIRPYKEALWSRLIVNNDDDLSNSLMMIRGLHGNLEKLLRSLDEAQLQRTFYHPEYEKSYSLVNTISTYSWHGNHHLAHIRQALDSKGAYLE
ncbi:MAG: putative metal-dependent hydrolase [Bacteroidia bacterium]